MASRGEGAGALTSRQPGRVILRRAARRRGRFDVAVSRRADPVGTLGGTRPRRAVRREHVDAAAGLAVASRGDSAGALTSRQPGRVIRRRAARRRGCFGVMVSRRADPVGTLG